jgi:glycopeptide antibiotics resistance protein
MKALQTLTTVFITSWVLAYIDDIMITTSTSYFNLKIVIIIYKSSEQMSRIQATSNSS